MTAFAEYANYDGLGLAGLVARKEVTPEELVEAAVERIEALNPTLNAVVHPMYESAREAARGVLPDGPFRGVPFLIKDLLSVYAGQPFSCGSRFLKDFVPDFDSEIVRRYKAAGLITLGKTNTPEFGLLPVTEPELFGPTDNPWDRTRTPGGSSGGSAAAVAARLVPLAGGGDGGGSIRIPASCCGLFGLKPTRGRTPTGPYRGDFWWGLVCEHGLTRSVRDSAALLDAISGPEPGAPYYATPPLRPFLSEVSEPPGKLRIAFTSKPFLGESVHEDCVRALEETVALLQGLGHDLVEAAPRIDGPAVTRAFLRVIGMEVRADIREAEMVLGRRASAREFETITWVIGLLGKHLAAADASLAMRTLQQASRTVGHFFEEYDLLLTPTLAQPPMETASWRPRGLMALGLELLALLNSGRLVSAAGFLDILGKQAFAFTPYTPIFNITGQPAMSVPLFWNAAGLPIGSHFVGRYGDEATLFRLAGQLEQFQPWSDRVPPLLAQPGSHGTESESRSTSLEIER